MDQAGSGTAARVLLRGLKCQSVLLSDFSIFEGSTPAACLAERCGVLRWIGSCRTFRLRIESSRCRGPLARPLLVGTQSSDPGSELCQSNTGRSTELKHQRRFGTEVVAAAIAAARIKTLIDSINRSVQSLDYDIETEEERTRCRDCRDPAYSVLARSLTARRDNLAATIAALEERLSRTEVLTAPTIGSATDLLLPA
jgi:hypothetical protein